MRLFPVFYGFPVCLRTETAWVSGSNLARSAQHASRFRILDASGAVPSGDDGNPKLVSYGDTITLQLLPTGHLVGRSPPSPRVHIGPPDTVLPLQFSLQPGYGQATGQPLSASVLRGAFDYSVNSVFFQTAVDGALAAVNNTLILSLTVATRFQLCLAETPRVPTSIALPLQLPPAYSHPRLPVVQPPWPEFEPPFTALTPIRPIIPINPTNLQIAKQPANIICLFSNSFCMPKWLAKIVVIFTLLTILVVIAAKVTEQ